MKVLAISASPRKGGNSDVLCDQFLTGAKEAGHEVSKLRLAEKQIAPCLACNACMRGEHSCVQHDDMAEILDALIAADVIVLATPVYFYSPAAQIKLMIDRCYPRYREIRGKQFYLIVTAADARHEAADETLAALRGFLRCLPDAKEQGVLYGTGAWDKGDIYRHPAFSKACQMGRSV